MISPRPYPKLETSNDQKNYFLSGPFVPAGKIISLDPETELINRFMIKSHIGHGRCGAVYVAGDILRSKDVALKIAYSKFNKENSLSRQLLQEIFTQDKIFDLRHIIRVYDLHFVPWEGTALILLSMELADGGSLRAWMSKNLDVNKRSDQALKYFKQACLGVQTSHKAGIVHLDLKPENMLILGGEVKISDYGLSRIMEDIGMMSQDSLQDGAGTAHYMAPEQILSANPKDVDESADIYALGCVLCELLTGDLPYTGSPQQILEKHERGIMPKLRGVQKRFADVIRKCVESDPAKRYALVSDLYEAFEDLDEKEKPQTILNEECDEKLKKIFECIDIHRIASEPGETFFQKVEKWIPDALDFLKSKAEAGNAEALYKLGILYFCGEGVNQDKGEAINLWGLSAENGHRMAQYNLGLCHDYGEGVPKNIEKAVKWYFKAAEKGVAAAQKDLGNCFFYGEGVPEDKNEAIKWFYRAALNESSIAQFSLGYCYLNGIGSPINKEEAERWIRKSCEQGNKAAIKLLKTI